MAREKAEFNLSLGTRIREAREEAGVTQDQLARAIGLSRTSITNIEKGRQGVQVYVLTRIAEVLGRSAADLLPLPGSLSSGELTEKLKNLEPGEREWAQRVLSSPKED